jgi:hypothetical protein
MGAQLPTGSSCEPDVRGNGLLPRLHPPQTCQTPFFLCLLQLCKGSSQNRNCVAATVVHRRSDWYYRCDYCCDCRFRLMLQLGRSGRGN